MTVTATVGKLGALAGKPRLIHEEVIDFLLVNPGCSNKDIAKHFGMSYQWCLILTNSDGFQRRYEERRKELIDPMIRTTLEDRMKGLVSQSVDVLMEKLEIGKDVNVALKSLDIGTRALGYGAKPTVQVNQHNQSFVVQVPPKAKDSGSWLEAHSPGRNDPPPVPLEAPRLVVEEAKVVGFEEDNPPGDPLALFARPVAEESDPSRSDAPPAQ